MEPEPSQQLRSEYKLRPLTKEEEGLALTKLPNGVYGFSYAPATETPLFARKSYHSFEVHKISDGTGYLIAFVASGDADRLRTRNEEIQITVYPDPHDEATSLVSIPFDRILSSLYKPIRYDANALPLRLTAI
jgi:hypothetical protein